MIDGPRIDVEGSAGWGLAESMMNGEVTVRGSAGNGAAAAIRGGTVVIHGDAAARLGVSMKGGTVLVAGNCGYMAGFMGQKGQADRLRRCRRCLRRFDVRNRLLCRRPIAGLGTDAVIETPLRRTMPTGSTATLARYLPEVRASAARNFKKVVAGRKLWNFDKREWKVWQEAL